MKKSAMVLSAMVILSCGGSGGAGGGVTVTANAGDNFTALVNAESALDGSASTGVTSSSWSFTSRPSGSQATITGANALTAAFTPDVVGDYVVQLSANGGASTDSVTVTAKNVVAAITVPADSTITLRNRLGQFEYVVDLGTAGYGLSGAASQAASGVTLTYAWEQVSGPSSTAVGGTTGSTLTFTAPTLANFQTTSDVYKWQPLPISRSDTDLVFNLTVSGNGDTDTATLIVHVEDAGEEIHTSSGLPNVAVGTTVYLSGPAYLASTANATTQLLGGPITDWSWSLSAPSGSSAVFADTGTTSSALQLPKFVADVAGIYTVTYSSTSGAVTTPATISINVADWTGVGTIGGTTATNPQCATCHDGGVQPDRTTGWTASAHATLFEDSMTTYAGLAPEPYLWEFHTVGFNKDADNGGFDDLAGDNSFTFPETGMTFAEFLLAEPETAVLANVQCENCHGPGDQHSGDPLRIDNSASQYGVCGQCHIQENAWINSSHNSIGVAHGRGAYQATWLSNAGCVRCHTGKGFIDYVNEGEEGLAAVTETGAFVGVTCAACHDPHNATNASQLRLAGNVTMVMDGSTVDAGKSAVCYSCHDGLYTFGEDDCDPDNDRTTVNNVVCETVDQTATQYFRQMHYNPQSPVLEGKGAITDLDGDGDADFTPDENSFHSGSTFTLAGATGDATLPAENNKCVTCHMTTGPAVDEEGYQHLGGHAFKLRSGHGLGHLLGEETEDDAVSEAEDLELISSCTACHSSVTEFNRLARADYDGDGSQEGIQDEITGLLVTLTTKIKSIDAVNVLSTSGAVSSGGTVTVDALSYTGAATNPQTDSFNAATATVRRAVWNYNLIARDGSLGVHNAAFAIQVLQGTYTAVGGNSFATDFPLATLR